MSYTFDPRNRLSQVNPGGTGGADATYVYDSIGNQAKVTYRNSVATAYTYNTRNQLRYVESTWLGNPVASFDYDDYANSGWAAANKLSNSGRRNRMKESIGGAIRTVDYVYDNLNRLTQESINGAASIGNSYDSVGNRLTRTSGVTGVTPTVGTVRYDVNDWIDNDSTATTPSTLFDANGNTLVPDLNGDGVIDSTEASYSYGYDIENRLITAVGGGKTVSIVYDADGNRVTKSVAVSGATTAAYYVVDAQNLTGYAQVLEERSATTGNPSVVYVYGLGLISQTQGGVTSYSGRDGLGTVRYLTRGDNGQISDTYLYDAFGINIGGTGTTANSYRYTGEQFDSDLGMYYLRARYYRPEIGRLWTMDSFEGENEDSLSLHKYVYARQNPVFLSDPSGNFFTVIEFAFASTLTIGARGQWESERSPSYSAGLRGAIAVAEIAGLALLDYLAEDTLFERTHLREYINSAKDEFRKRFPGKNLPKVVPMPAERIPAVAAHVARAQGIGKPMILKRAPLGQNIWNRMKVLMSKGPAPSGMSWDEYPFASSIEGGNPRTVSIEPVPFRENLIQGGIIAASYYLENIQPYDKFAVVVLP